MEAPFFELETGNRTDATAKLAVHYADNNLHFWGDSCYSIWLPIKAMLALAELLLRAYDKEEYVEARIILREKEESAFCYVETCAEEAEYVCGIQHGFSVFNFNLVNDKIEKFAYFLIDCAKSEDG